MDNVRIDKWLFAARFFKTRSLAADAVDRGRVRIDGEPVKPARAVKLDDKIAIDNGSDRWEVVVLGISDKRGAAPIARALVQRDRREHRQARERFGGEALVSGAEPGDQRAPDQARPARDFEGGRVGWHTLRFRRVGALCPRGTRCHRRPHPTQ